MKNTPRQIVVAMLYTDCIYIYKWILKFFKQTGEFCYFLNCSFYELANPLCLWISGTAIVWFMCIFSLFIVQKCCVHTFMYCTAGARVQVCAIRVFEPRCRVLKKVSEILIMFGISFRTKIELFTRIWY